MHERPPITPIPVRLTPRKTVTSSPVVSTTLHQSPKKKESRDGRFYKGVVVVIGAMLLTTLASKASDNFQVSDVLLLAGVGQSKNDSRCPPEMAFIPTAEGGFCIDRYEVSTGQSCQFQTPSSVIQTNEDISNISCIPDSVKGDAPWVNTTLSQAMSLCARAGKRLPTPGEWYRASLGTPDWTDGSPSSCVLGILNGGSAEMAGMKKECVSSFGVYDMVGNVWEWVDASVTDGVYNNRVLPLDGYISEADADGVATLTSGTSSAIFGDDYFYTDQSGVRGMLRGGFWGLSGKAGIYTINNTVQTSFSGNAVGFRCVK